MAIKTTRWSPDTCGCVVEYEWDDAVPANVRTHTFKRVVTRCANHVALTPAEVWNDVSEENPRKNRAEARLLQAFPNVVGDPATGLTTLLPGAYAYRFRSGSRPRVIELALPLLSAAQRTAVQTWCDNNLGAGRVEVYAALP